MNLTTNHNRTMITQTNNCPTLLQNPPTYKIYSTWVFNTRYTKTLNFHALYLKRYKQNLDVSSEGSSPMTVLSVCMDKCTGKSLDKFTQQTLRLTRQHQHSWVLATAKYSVLNTVTWVHCTKYVYMGKTGYNNIVESTLFRVVNNYEQYCWAWTSQQSGVTILNNINNVAPTTLCHPVFDNVKFLTVHTWQFHNY